MSFYKHWPNKFYFGQISIISDFNKHLKPLPKLTTYAHYIMALSFFFFPPFVTPHLLYTSTKMWVHQHSLNIASIILFLLITIF